MAWVQLAREVGGEDSLRHVEPEFFERAFHPRHLMELTERNPEAALAWVQLARDVGGEDFLRRVGTEFFDRILSPSYLTRPMYRKPVVLAVILRLLRATENTPHLSEMLARFSSFLRPRDGSASLLDQIPISALPDIQWLAHKTSQSESGRALRDWLIEKGFGQNT